MTSNIWKDKHVLLTGHTGFKGAWLSLWLSTMGAKVHGVSLDPPTEPNFFAVAKLASLLASDHRLDIRNFEALNKLFSDIKPDVVFHLAAQSLVQCSYDFPLETYSVNVLGTAHVLEAIRRSEVVRAAVIVTTDKCYENQERVVPYVETDRLGGFDPYSNSKACAELVTSAYRNSYFSSKPGTQIASARAGNVIGGGDWAANRLVPDCIRAYISKTTMNLRYPQAVRPWQHVLESLQGYLLLAEHLLGSHGSHFAEAWNFGPELEDMQTVGEVAKRICDQFQIAISMPQNAPNRHETSLLRLDSTKAKQRLHWQPRWPLKEALEETIDWYSCWLGGGDMQSYSRSQLERYSHSRNKCLAQSASG